MKRNGAAVATAQLGSTRMADNDVITVESGKDQTEAHTVRYDTVKYGTDINLNNGPLQEVKQLGKDGMKEIQEGSRQGIQEGTAESGGTVAFATTGRT